MIFVIRTSQMHSILYNRVILGSKLLLPDAVLRSVFMPQNHFREPKNRREHLLSSLPIVLPVAAVTISAAAFGLLFLQGNPVESAEETVTYTAAIGAADEQVEMYVYDAGNDEVEKAEEEASEMECRVFLCRKRAHFAGWRSRRHRRACRCIQLCAIICFKRQSCGARRADTA